MSLAWIEGTSWSSDEMWQPVKRLVLRLKSCGVSTVIIDHTNASGQVFGTKTKLWHCDLAMRLTPIEGDDSAGEGLHFPVDKCPKETMKIRVSWDKIRSGTPLSDFAVALGEIGTPWSIESGGSEMLRRAREMKRNGLSIREIAEELGISKSRAGRLCKDA